MRRGHLSSDPIEIPSATNILVIDPVGEVYDRVGQAGLATRLWRVLDARRIANDSASDRIVYSAYAPLDWELVSRASERAPLLVITTTYRRSEAEEALRRYLLGYVDAALPDPAFRRAIRGALLAGEPGFSRDVLGAWVRELRQATRAKEHVTGLTFRQTEILSLIAQGATDKEVGAKLGIATATAQKHVTNILRRLGVPNRAAAVAVAAPRRHALRPLRPFVVQSVAAEMDEAS